MKPFFTRGVYGSLRFSEQAAFSRQNCVEMMSLDPSCPSLFEAFMRGAPDFPLFDSRFSQLAHGRRVGLKSVCIGDVIAFLDNPGVRGLFIAVFRVWGQTVIVQ
jgi:hypothetical protein